MALRCHNNGLERDLERSEQDYKQIIKFNQKTIDDQSRIIRTLEYQIIDGKHLEKSSDVRERLLKQLECAICFQEVFDDPSQPCFHPVCKGCEREAITKKRKSSIRENKILQV